MGRVPLISVKTDRVVVTVTLVQEQTALSLLSGARLSHCATGRERSYLRLGAECCWVVQNRHCQSELISSCRYSPKSSWGSLRSSSASPKRNAGLDHTHSWYRTLTLNFVPWTSALWALRQPFCSCIRPHTVTSLCWEVTGTKLALGLWILLLRKVKQVSVLHWWPKCFCLP